MILIREAMSRWSMRVSHLDVPVQTGLRLRIDQKAVAYTGPMPKDPPEFLICQVVSWEYQITDEERASLEVVVEDMNAAGPISDNQAMTAIGLGAVTCIVLAIQSYVFYRNPEKFWAFFGHNVQWFGSVVLVILFAVIFPTRMGLRKRTRFRDLFMTAILCWTGIAMVFLWLSFTRSSGSAGGDAAVGHAIAARLRANNWPLLLAALPWAALVFKLLGYEVAEKTTSVVLDAAKAKD